MNLFLYELFWSKKTWFLFKLKIKPQSFSQPRDWPNSLFVHKIKIIQKKKKPPPISHPQIQYSQQPSENLIMTSLWFPGWEQWPDIFKSWYIYSGVLCVYLLKKWSNTFVLYIYIIHYTQYRRIYNIYIFIEICLEVSYSMDEFTELCSLLFVILMNLWGVPFFYFLFKGVGLDWFDIFFFYYLKIFIQCELWQYTTSQTISK